MKLFGSNTSPYVRRLRVWLGERDFDYVNMDIFSHEGRATLKQKNPTLKIPMLEDGAQIIFDSNVIYRYLTIKSYGNTVKDISLERFTRVSSIVKPSQSPLKVLSKP